MSISVIIAAYNASSTIADTLRSVLAQTLPPEEILVVDDGSTDDTAAIAESFGAPVRVFRRSNVKQAASRNFGAEQAHGEWIAFVDADDLWEPLKLERQMEELRANPRADVCYTALTEFWVADGKVHTGNTASVPPPDELGRSLFRRTSFLPSSVVIRRSTFLDVGGFNASLPIIEDWELWLRLYHRGVQFAACQEALVRYRIHPESTSHNALIGLQLLNKVYLEQVYPYLPRRTRWFHYRRTRSGQEAVAALALRRADDPQYLRLMFRSLRRFPFHMPHRYKIFAHMLYTRLTRQRSR